MKQIINPIGKEINTLGKVIDNKELMLVHLQLKSGEKVPSHDHKGQEVYFTIVKGTVEMHSFTLSEISSSNYNYDDGILTIALTNGSTAKFDVDFFDGLPQLKEFAALLKK